MEKYAVYAGPDWVKDVDADSPEDAVAQVNAEGGATPADRAELISSVESGRTV